jgi:HAD superfamily hydrolase (TIGR01662 family)
MIQAVLFDWGNTLMVDFNLPGPMYEWKNVAWVPGVEAALRQISGNYPCYVATNAGESDAKAVMKGLERVGARKYFKAVFASSDLGFEKPDGMFYNAIISRLRIPAVHLVMIGDNYIKDVEGAKRCGLKTIYYNAMKKEGIFPMADLIIEEMGELPSAIGRL